MNGVRIRICEDYFNILGDALAEPEEVVFLYASFAENLFEVEGLEVMAGADIFRQSKVHVELADEIRPRVIKSAWNTDRCLIEAHSHGTYGNAEFSPSDLRGFREWVTHVRWRLRGRPYLALVKAGETWDALAWVNGDEPTSVDAIEITSGDGTVIETVRPTNATAGTLTAGGES